MRKPCIVPRANLTAFLEFCKDLSLSIMVVGLTPRKALSLMEKLISSGFMRVLKKLCKPPKMDRIKVRRDNT